MKSNRFIVIVGCGRLGSNLASRLSRQGDSVVVIDHRRPPLDNLSEDFSGFRLEGDATQMTVLKEAQLHKADIFLATTQDDNVNLMVAQVAHKVFNVPQVLVRVYDPRREEVYARLGIKTICPITLAADSFLRSLASEELSEREALP